MGLVTKSYTFSAGQVIIAAEHNADFDDLYTLVNGNIGNANISLTANIASSKLATITTAGKVNITALVATSQAAGDLIYYNSGWKRLGIGTTGQTLTVAAGLPSWA